MRERERDDKRISKMNKNGISTINFKRKKKD